MAILNDEGYDILDQAQSEPRRLKIIHVGAGASGLLAAYKAERMLDNYELICYEKNPTIGGTWWENRYPGCACDVPAHIYTYSFEPNPEWSGFYSFSSEIQAYFIRFYEKYKLQPYIQLNTQVTEALWNEEQGKYKGHVGLMRDGNKSVVTCDVLLNGSGVVNKWKWPDIAGLNSFTGVLAHSASWDPTITWEGKRVAIIGTGSSSIQMLPHLAQGSRSVHVFARNKTWISPQMGSDISKESTGGGDTRIVGRHIYSEEEKHRFRTNKEFFLSYRKDLEARMTKSFPIFLRGSPLNLWARKAMRESMVAKIGPGHDELKENLIPDWSPGCRRITPGEGYLESLTRDRKLRLNLIIDSNTNCLADVYIVHEGVAQLNEKGLVTTSGKTFEFDIIACATGFSIQYVPHFKITGVNGAIIQDEWSEIPNIYLSIASPKFPNYFVVNGPTGNWGQGCVLPSHEVQIEYALQCCKKMQEDGIKAIEVKQLPTTQINEHLDTWHSKKSVWAEDCRSWYKDNKPNGRVYIWPGSLLHHLRALKTPRFEHYDIRYMNSNMWAFLGNGFTDLEVDAINGKDVDLAPFIRDSDTPWSLDAPKVVQK
ncbi:hypothetical protein OIDMADRAFT_119824 [Oidiodendron maius Zn]|uniref:FAD/NAD(P)-binding domain-containing protein n=1 Tax=Oidiodendron maius (strain Zn) TaxID=913774 RepID=A0A0C3HLQ3_OIDMZ|nr:hypothetical protein OIDMADRAFT_119824 [Oidiodendron maius Zn]